MFLLKFSSNEIPNVDVKMRYNDLTNSLPKEVDLKCSEHGMRQFT